MLAGRMAWLSIAQNERYTMLSESNRVNMTLLPPRRGWIVDRHGVPIANNRTDFRVDIIPDRLRDKERVLPLLGRILQLPPEEIERIGRSLIDRRRLGRRIARARVPIAAHLLALLGVGLQRVELGAVVVDELLLQRVLRLLLDRRVVGLLPAVQVGEGELDAPEEPTHARL